MSSFKLNHKTHHPPTPISTPTKTHHHPLTSFLTPTKTHHPDLNPIKTVAEHHRYPPNQTHETHQIMTTIVDHKPLKLNGEQMSEGEWESEGEPENERTGGRVRKWAVSKEREN